MHYARQGKAKQVDHVGRVQLKFVVRVGGAVGFLEKAFFLIANVASFLACLGYCGRMPPRRGREF